MFKKLKKHLENINYEIQFKKRYKSLDLQAYKIKNEKFEGKNLNIAFLSFDRGSFTTLNIIEPLKEYGNFHLFEFKTNPFDRKWYDRKNEENERMYEFVKSLKDKLDVIVCYLSGHTAKPEVLEKIKKFEIPMINLAFDDERKFASRKGKDGIRRGVKEICKYFDISVTTSKSAIKKYLVEGCNPLYSYLGVNDEIYIKKNIPKKYDVSFIGANYGVRGEYIEYLRKKGINVYTRGNGWKEGFASQEEIIDIFNASKIVLGFATVGKNDDIYIIKGRDFEAPMCGSFYITSYHDELNEWYEVGKEIETYSSKEELLEKIRYYLENEKKRENIAKKGYERCTNTYTSKYFFDTLFNKVGI